LIGWVDYVGTRSAQQQRGLGRAALLAGLERLRAWGAESARLVTISANLPAIRLYQAAGFSQVEVSEAASYQQVIPAS
jgi:ribosomal protein S18 acetylase RimI-like enzyme